MKKIVVVGNVTLDVICQTVNDVPRYESLSLDRVALSPGGCASNVAVGLGALGLQPYLICKTGDDTVGEIIRSTWRKFGINLQYVKVEPGINTAVSIGLVDENAQPRFIHTPGANAYLRVDDLMFDVFDSGEGGIMHIGGFFVLPGFLDHQLAECLKNLQSRKFLTSLDVVNSKRFWKPEYLYTNMPFLDIFLCNKREAQKLGGKDSVKDCAKTFREYGVRNVIIKLGGEGCYVDSEEYSGYLDAVPVQVVDTTGAGDAFAVGLIARLVKGEGIKQACEFGMQVAAKVVQELGTITYWEKLIANKTNEWV